MDDKITIFISHSSKDAQFVQHLSDQLEASDKRLTVFASTRPDSIPSGVDWQEEILKHLEAASVLIILITTPSINSAWVGFELGYFWKKNKGKGIFALYHPTALIPSPLDQLQAKLITDYDQLKNFFVQLDTALSIDLSDIDLYFLVEQAQKLKGRPPERSLANFERLLEQAEWETVYLGDQEACICVDDVLFQILIDYETEDIKIYAEDWMRKFPDKDARRYPVRLTVSGLTIAKLYFVVLDGGRYRVPFTEILADSESDKRILYWSRKSLRFKVAQVIGYFDPIHPTIEAFAKYCGVEIVE